MFVKSKKKHENHPFITKYDRLLPDFFLRHFVELCLRKKSLISLQIILVVQLTAILNAPAELIIWCTDCRPLGELEVNDGNDWTNTNAIISLARTVPNYATKIARNYNGGGFTDWF